MINNRSHRGLFASVHCYALPRRWRRMEYIRKYLRPSVPWVLVGYIKPGRAIRTIKYWGSRTWHSITSTGHNLLRGFLTQMEATQQNISITCSEYHWNPFHPEITFSMYKTIANIMWLMKSRVFTGITPTGIYYNNPGDPGIPIVTETLQATVRRQGGFWGCSICNKIFKRKDRAREHVDTHNGQKRFACGGECGLGTWWASSG